ncbi:MAG: hypothetical protein Kow0080_29710 [Candidatus Promineifilaceae bacterium]
MTKWKRILVLVVLLGLLVTGGGILFAQTGGSYSLTWSTVDSGGGSLSGGSYALSGTAGQADAGLLSGGSYTLLGGFWGAGASSGVTGYTVYLPAVLK